MSQSKSFNVQLNEQQLKYIKKAIQLSDSNELFELELFVDEDKADEVGDVLCTKIDYTLTLDDKSTVSFVD